MWKNAWVYVVVVAVVAATAAFIVHTRLREIPDLAIGHSPPAPVLGKPRERAIDYEVDGPPGTPITVSYLDEHGNSRDDTAVLPWRLRLHTRKLTLPTGVIAQADAAGVACRIRIDGQLRDQHSSTDAFSVVNCKEAVS